MSAASVFDDLAGDVTERASEGGELLVGRMKEFCSVKDERSLSY